MKSLEKTIAESLNLNEGNNDTITAYDLMCMFDMINDELEWDECEVDLECDEDLGERVYDALNNAKTGNYESGKTVAQLIRQCKSDFYIAASSKQFVQDFDGDPAMILPVKSNPDIKNLFKKIKFTGTVKIKL